MTQVPAELQLSSPPPEEAGLAAVQAEPVPDLAAGARPPAADGDDPPDDPQPGSAGDRLAALVAWARNAVAESPSWLTSMVVHAVLLLILALTTMPLPRFEDLKNLVVTTPGPGEEALDDFPLETETEQPAALPDDLMASSPSTVESIAVSPLADLDAAPASIDLSDLGADTAPRTDLLQQSGVIGGTGVSGRGAASRGALVRQRGGSDASERAVALALVWLAEHQMPDGGWSFDHRLGSCQGRCRNPGAAVEARRAATAMALLPFLGAGQTHKEGKYKTTVSRGLYFLLQSMQATPIGGSFYEKQGRLYSHGLASIAVCEAYAMTRDKDLFEPARQAISFTCGAQDQLGGGWRYEVGQPGDTSAVGWQLMALKSAHMAYLDVPGVTVQRANKFLDSVQKPNGMYGYTDGGGGGPGTTAVGLLCRMYLGWKRDHPQLRAGVAYLDRLGPDPNNMYYDYYATQVMHHFEGEEWKRWNKKMRDHLVNTQAADGHERGSWFFEDPHGMALGGRLYSTSLATMILEVYYRHMPIYGKDSTENEFPD
ncbi:MAG: prenyltransferase/squalene oxidase repeat-containing protein [Pirellulales bacterium]